MRIAAKRAVIDLAAVVAGILVATWMVREDVPVEVTGIYFSGVPDAIHSTPDHIVPQKQKFVPPGKTAVFRMVGEKFRNCPAVVSEEVIDSEGSTYRLPARIGGVNETGQFNTYISVPIDPDAAEGWATFRQRASYGIDPISFCFRTYVNGPNERPTARFWIGNEPPKWMRADRSPR